MELASAPAEEVSEAGRLAEGPLPQCFPLHDWGGFKLKLLELQGGDVVPNPVGYWGILACPRRVWIPSSTGDKEERKWTLVSHLPLAQDGSLIHLGLKENYVRISVPHSGGDQYFHRQLFLDWLFSQSGSQPVKAALLSRKVVHHEGAGLGWRRSNSLDILRLVDEAEHGRLTREEEKEAKRKSRYV